MTPPRHNVTFKFEFPPDVQAEGEPVLRTLDRATYEATPEAVREAQSVCTAWPEKHPENYAVWDAGEPVAMLADALEIVAREERAQTAEAVTA